MLKGRKREAQGGEKRLGKGERRGGGERSKREKYRVDVKS